MTTDLAAIPRGHYAVANNSGQITTWKRTRQRHGGGPALIAWPSGHGSGPIFQNRTGRRPRIGDLVAQQTAYLDGIAAAIAADPAGAAARFADHTGRCATCARRTPCPCPQPELEESNA